MAKRRVGFGTIALGALTVLTAAFSVSQSALAMQTSQCGYVCEEGASQGGSCTVHYVCQTTTIAPQGGFRPVPKPHPKTSAIRNNVGGGNRLTSGGNNLTAPNKAPSASLTASSTTSLLRKH